jgi:hypothetical protein
MPEDNLDNLWDTEDSLDKQEDIEEEIDKVKGNYNPNIDGTLRIEDGKLVIDKIENPINKIIY